MLQGSGQQAGVGAQGPFPLCLSQLRRLPPGLEHLQGGQQAQAHPVFQGEPVPSRQNRAFHCYTPVSIRREATSVTFSSTILPRVALSWMELH